jgi:hypothetical protein
MVAADTRSERTWATQARPYWLPPNGTGNGISARAWAPIADADELEALAILTACTRHGIAAFTAPRDGFRPHPNTGPTIYRVWVDSEHFGGAEDALRQAIAEVRVLTRSGRSPA